MPEAHRRLPDITSEEGRESRAIQRSLLAGFQVSSVNPCCSRSDGRGHFIARGQLKLVR
jgi:hypothetical protein